MIRLACAFVLIFSASAHACDLNAEKAAIAQSMIHVGHITPEQAADMHNRFVDGMKGIQQAEADGFPEAACDRAESLKKYFQSKFPGHQPQ